MKLRINPTQTPGNSQQGFVLALALMMMLFVGIIVISSADRTGTETRIAQSTVHNASLQAAAEAGAFTLRSASKPISGDDEEHACNEFEAYLLEENYDQPQIFMNQPSIWWQYVGFDEEYNNGCEDVLGSPGGVRAVIKAWQGSADQSHLVAKLELRAIVNFEEEDDEEESPFEKALGTNSAASWGGVNVSGGGHIQGDVTADEVSLSGGASIYSTDDPAQISTANFNKPNWMNLPSAVEADEYQAIQADPLNLQGVVDDLEIEPNDIQDLRSELGNKRIGQYGAGQVTISPAGVTNAQGGTGDLGKIKEVSVLGKSNAALYTVDEFRLQSGGQGNPTLKIEGGDIIIYVAGDVSFSGGTSLEIADDASLTLVVEGQTTVSGGFNFMSDDSSNFAIYSNYSHNSPNATGVNLSGGGHVHGLIYAAHSNVDITGGSYVRGQVMAANINVTGGTGIYYEDVKPGGSSGPGRYIPSPDIEIDFEYR